MVTAAGIGLVVVLWGLDHVGLIPNATPQMRRFGWLFIVIGLFYLVIALVVAAYT
jgi:heme/copper-type cytochrome/quinol oxidase subunit 2